MTRSFAEIKANLPPHIVEAAERETQRLLRQIESKKRRKSRALALGATDTTIKPKDLKQLQG